jgi:hypothetical protein
LASDSEILDGQSSLSEFKEADNDTSLPIEDQPINDPLINDQPINESSVASSSESIRMIQNFSMKLLLFPDLFTNEKMVQHGATNRHQVLQPNRLM